MAYSYINQDLRLKYFEPLIKSPKDITNLLDFFGSPGKGLLRDRGDTKITQIIIHFTAGWTAEGAINHFLVDLGSNSHVATPFVIESNVSKSKTSNSGGYDQNLSNGQIYRVFEDYKGKYTDHVSSSAIHKRSIGIEVVNLGWLEKTGEDFYFAGTKLNLNDNLVVLPENRVEVITYADAYRQKHHFHKMNSSQLISLKDLIIYLAGENNIPLEVDPENIGKYNSQVVKGKPGIFSHTSCVTETAAKWDWHPQPELVEMLEELKILGKAKERLHYLRNVLLTTGGGENDPINKNIIGEFLDEIIRFFLIYDDYNYPSVGNGKRTVKKLNESIQFNPQTQNYYQEFPNIALFYKEILLPHVKPNYHEAILDSVYRIYGDLESSRYREYYFRHVDID